MLELKDVTISYKDKTVLNKLSLSASAGEIIGLVAPNGTGKTTLFNVIANFIQPNKGSITFMEKLAYKNERQQIAIHKQLTTFPEQSDLFDELSGLDHLKLYGNMWKGSTKHINGIIEYLNMGHYVKKKVRTYSLGMRQRLCFAMLVAADTPIMLMDEVMNGLDIDNVALISKKLAEMKQENKLIFVASHLLENLDLYADRVMFLKDGKIIHELKQDVDHHDDHIKIEMEVDQYEKLKGFLPKGHQYIANHLLCVPLADMQTTEKIEWIERLLAYKEKELTIGPLGTIEYYEKYYEKV
ncbi:ATP-binding cassette domain-containing protein [Ornithinibacillus scapharcae]|uniref:ATP-binding cassette domain-containing protein n=1 Tax=Ornithinibacillus scapharcae TaxID=1147159 RepID=UPI000225B6B0|nr:ABC transporter ATP-binding protein [Ornithinibacillus scapharcae]